LKLSSHGSRVGSALVAKTYDGTAPKPFLVAIAIHPTWYEDRRNQFLCVIPLRSLFKASVGLMDNWVSQYISPHGEFEKISLRGVHVHNQGCQEAHHHIIIQYDSNLASSQFISLKPRKIHIRAVYFV